MGLANFGGVIFGIALLTGCNSDRPAIASTQVLPHGYSVTVTRVATHPFLARYNLSLKVVTRSGCSAASELFPDTGGVSRRNLYLAPSGRLYLVGQFDVRRFDEKPCRAELIEFRSLETGLTFLGSFDVDGTGRWSFFSSAVREEQPFEKL